MNQSNAPYLVSLEWEELCAISGLIALFLNKVEKDPVIRTHATCRALRRAQQKLVDRVR